ncbi:DmpA family aminopeptidase [Flavihumibacter petaseus]|uniref:D-aminopeptidase DmpA n=1 Tax=Flavihumibacter petaseus NBRC 106054 TaxID=1220578 RepID=A0A0E9MY20_9BACT|nr:P1 family peptidase [Flavihumibacter petaseus]GAO42627.1 D-aminopeptidase DmpA [Flavihumibacter petaseus NBRC 106054]
MAFSQVGDKKQERQRPRQFGIVIGVLPTGRLNSITDVFGVKVGQVTLIKGDSVRTGVTAILPHGGNIFQEKVPGAVFVGNGFGKLAGSTQVEELGNIESPIVLTNTLNVPSAATGIIQYTLQQAGNDKVASVNALVGETNDGWLNNIRAQYVQIADVMQAIRTAGTEQVLEGNVGAGTGTVCFGFKGGIGTASRKLPASLGGYTVGVLVQTNFGGVLQVDGVPVGEELRKFSFSQEILQDVDGSCMMVVATDAPIDARNLKRLAKRAFLGLGRTGGIASNGSGDYVIAFSTAPGLRIPHESKSSLQNQQTLTNDAMSPLFMAAIEATEEAIINSLFMATDMQGFGGHTVQALPLEETLKIIRKYNRR